MPSSPTARILVIDDEQRIRQTVASCLEQEGHAVTTVATAQAARDAVAHEPFDLAFLDLRLGGTSGLDLMPDLLEQQPNLKVVVITAYASVETAVEAMKQGAPDYLPKPFKPAQVRVAAERAAKQRALEGKVDVLEEQVANRPSDVMMESESPAMTPVLDTARRALREYRWPGNVRELKNAAERAVILSQSTHIVPSHLPITASDTDEEAAEPDVAVGRRVSLETLEKAHIRRVVATTETLEDAAEVLDIDPATLYRKRRKYDLV